MEGTQRQGGRLWVTIILGSSAVLLAASIVISPGAAFEASLQGLTLWWRIVFPGLLPFLVLSQILVAYGLVHAVGITLDPLLRKGLGTPGVAGWVIPLGLIAGFPAAAEASVQLYRGGRITARQAEKLAAAGHFCNPMLIIVVVGTGFLHKPGLGLLLAVVHGIAGIAAGLTLHKVILQSRRDLYQAGPEPIRTGSKAQQIARSIEEARRLDGRSFGKLLGDTVAAAVQTLMMIGGYMLIFAVVIRMLQYYIPGLVPSFFLPGIFEVHLGTYAAGGLYTYSPALQAALLGAILGFSGLCAYLQVRAILRPAGIGTGGFLITRILHGSYAYVLTLLLWEPLIRLFPGAAPVYGDISPHGKPDYGILQLPSWTQTFSLMGWQFIALLSITAALMLFTVLWRFRYPISR
ncbi:nucleoside recognition domain-containing protein [Paenibacillus sp. YPG26]|uniref:nucleoside recognition domain-containing protein n=1 Tax=Paenibacillus sp. YPG26 TaxID=2878915 RepID=UPI0020422982|nr:nucleoside recognition domain-containing protein [Paenibacillus sp. YPG26]USB32143.1 nucleoside recognition domain-containing protein [Paenibacillus sp. YPG26]